MVDLRNEEVEETPIPSTDQPEASRPSLFRAIQTGGSEYCCAWAENNTSPLPSFGGELFSTVGEESPTPL